MLSKWFRFSVFGLIALSLAACETGPTKQQTGTVLGGVIGGVLGSQIGGGSGKTIATIAGVLVGAYIGGYIGKSMDENDRYKAQQALEDNRVNQPSSWRNPDNGNNYTVTPTRTFTGSGGEPCRDYTTEAVIDGKKEIIHGTACRQADNTWQAAN